MTITIVSGTNRPRSCTRQIAAQVEAIYRALDLRVRLLDLADLPPELFAPAAYAEKPPAFAPFPAAVLDADGLVVVTPEYNGGIPGVLEYFIDMLPFPESFEGRAVCFVGLAAGMWGALRPVEQRQAIFGYCNAGETNDVARAACLQHPPEWRPSLHVGAITPSTSRGLGSRG